MQHRGSFVRHVATGTARVLQKVPQAVEVAQGGRVVCSRGAILRGRVGRHAAPGDQPDEALEAAVSRRVVDGRGTEVVALVERAQLSVGGREAAGVAKLRSPQGGLRGPLAIPANV